MAATPKINWPEDEALFAMIRQGMDARAIAKAIGCSSGTASEKLRKIGCTYNRSGSPHFWTLPDMAQPETKPVPAPKRKATLREEFPFIRTFRVDSRDGEKITLPFITMHVLESGKFGSVAR